MIKVCIFEKLKSKYPMETSLGTIARIMKESDRLRELSKSYQSMLTINPDKAKHDKTTKIPAFSPIALMFDGKARNNIYGLTDMCLLDVDVLNIEEIDKIKKMLCLDKNVILAAKSISGKGMHIIVRYEITNMPHPFIANMKPSTMNKIYGLVFSTVSKLYSNKYNFTVDVSGSNMERLCLLSFDDTLYYNESAERLQLTYSKRNITINESNSML